MNKLFSILLSLVLLSGCVLNGRLHSLSLYPVPNQHRTDLSATDVVNIMKRAGFSDEEIMELGTSLRNYMATHGACQVSNGKLADTIIAAHQDTIYIVSHLRGSSCYDLKQKAFK